jgi:hypothetical protein
MREFTPDVPVETEFLLADRWYKGVEEQPRDMHGRIVPFVGAAECLVASMQYGERNEVK